MVILIGANGWRPRLRSPPCLLYVLVYTPLKPWTTLNTAIGAIPGAAASHRLGGCDRTLGVEPLALFLIVFLWQFPHFLAIAWIYRDDYARGGLKMLPEVDPHGYLTGAPGHRLCPCTSAGRSLAGDGRALPAAFTSWALRAGNSLSVRRRQVLGLASRNRPRGGCCECRLCICPRFSCFFCSTRCRPERRSGRLTLSSVLVPRDSHTMADATASPTLTQHVAH